jgi:hypothetical protein
MFRGPADFVGHIFAAGAPRGNDLLLEAGSQITGAGKPVPFHQEVSKISQQSPSLKKAINVYWVA